MKGAVGRVCEEDCTGHPPLWWETPDGIDSKVKPKAKVNTSSGRKYGWKRITLYQIHRDVVT